MLDGHPPYKQLLTHGFCVDQNGEKMSKSKGNIVRPQEISESSRRILRLWVASTDYSGELRLGPTILNRVVESYRRIRNTLRFLLANTSDFPPRPISFRLKSSSNSTAGRSPSRRSFRTK